MLDLEEAGLGFRPSLSAPLRIIGNGDAAGSLDVLRKLGWPLPLPPPRSVRMERAAACALPSSLLALDSTAESLRVRSASAVLSSELSPGVEVVRVEDRANASAVRLRPKPA